MTQDRSLEVVKGTNNGATDQHSTIFAITRITTSTAQTSTKVLMPVSTTLHTFNCVTYCYFWQIELYLCTFSPWYYDNQTYVISTLIPALVEAPQSWALHVCLHLCMNTCFIIKIVQCNNIKYLNSVLQHLKSY